jgi:hypothetical protein
MHVERRTRENGGSGVVRIRVRLSSGGRAQEDGRRRGYDGEGAAEATPAWPYASPPLGVTCDPPADDMLRSRLLISAFLRWVDRWSTDPDRWLWRHFPSHQGG